MTPRDFEPEDDFFDDIELPEELAEQLAFMSEEQRAELFRMLDSAAIPVLETEPVDGLKDILAMLEDEELKLACEMHGFAFADFDVERASREELEDQALLLLGGPSVHERAMFDMGPSMRDEYVEIMRSPRFAFPLEGDAEQAFAHLRGLLDALASMMLVFPFVHGGEMTYVVPPEVRRGCEIAIEDGFLEFAAEKDLVFQYIDAAVNLYGAIALDDLVAIVDKQNPAGFDGSPTKGFLLDVIEGEQLWAYFEDAGLLAHEIFRDDAGLGYEYARELAAHAQAVPRYMPEKEAFLAYANPNYFDENFEAELLQELLVGFFPDNAVAMEDTVLYVQDCARQGIRNEVLIETLLEDFLPGPFANDAQANLVIKQLAKLVRSTRCWACNGRTPAEVDLLAGKR